MSTLHAVVLAILQGVTELFPISSLGHAVIVPSLFGWPIDQRSAEFLPFVVVLHIGTAVALLAYFWREWLNLGLGFIDWHRPSAADARHAFWLIVIATIPAVVIGFIAEKLVRGLFASPLIAALFLIVNGFVLLFGDRLRRRDRLALDSRGHRQLTWMSALWIGLWQCLAFIPGISRSGAAMVGGLINGLHHEDAAHFSFLIATPIIAGAAVLEVPKLLALPGHGISGLVVASGVVAGITAYLSTAVLMRYFRRFDFDDALVPFAVYCWFAGAAASAVFIL
jgi:undecaprenyl-diphosphatase